ncbi:MAG: DUF433 domain-containing protein [Chloroflexota bacterium]
MWSRRLRAIVWTKWQRQSRRPTTRASCGCRASLGGQPVIDVHRISVASIARFLNRRTSVDEIIATYPHLGAPRRYTTLSATTSTTTTR